MQLHDLCWAADGTGWFLVTELGGAQAHNDVWFVPQSEPLARMREPETLLRVARALRAVHSGPPVRGRFNSFRVVEEYRTTEEALEAVRGRD